MITCPQCHGDREYRTISTADLTPAQCDECDGFGQITDARAAAIATGKALIAIRHSRDESLREMAKRTGINVVRLSDMERGRIPAEPEHWL